MLFPLHHSSHCLLGLFPLSSCLFLFFRFCPFLFVCSRFEEFSFPWVGPFSSDMQSGDDGGRVPALCRSTLLLSMIFFNWEQLGSNRASWNIAWIYSVSRMFSSSNCSFVNFSSIALSVWGSCAAWSTDSKFDIDSSETYTSEWFDPIYCLSLALGESSVLYGFSGCICILKYLDGSVTWLLFSTLTFCRPTLGISSTFSLVEFLKVADLTGVDKGFCTQISPKRS